jgi:hypothetical protein
MAGMDTKGFILAAAALAALESVLILGGLLTPVMAYSPGNIIFLSARFLLLLYAGWSCGMKDAAIRGSLISATAVLVFILFSLAGATLARPVLGVPAQSLPVLYIILMAMNSILGAIIASVSSFISSIIKPRKLTKKP